MFKDVYLFLPPCAVLIKWVGHLWSTGVAIISNRGVSEGLQGRKRRKVSQRKKRSCQLSRYYLFLATQDCQSLNTVVEWELK